MHQVSVSNLTRYSKYISVIPLHKRIIREITNELHGILIVLLILRVAVLRIVCILRCRGLLRHIGTAHFNVKKLNVIVRGRLQRV